MSNFRDKKILENARLLPCQICGKQDGTVCAAHSNQQRDGKGMGIKAHDYRIASLCFECHSSIDQGSQHLKKKRQEMWDEAHRKTIGEMIERGLLSAV